MNIPNMENGGKSEGILGQFGRRYTDFIRMGFGHSKSRDFLSVLPKLN